MAETVRKLIVEVVEARDLLPKDGVGTSSPYVVVDFDGQRKRTQTVCRDLNPTWNEVLEFDVISGTIYMAGEPLEVDVLHDRKVGPSRRNNFLGRVRLDSKQFVRKGEEALIHFPLQKKSFWSWIRGDVGLKIYYIDVPIVIPEPSPPPAAENAGDEQVAPPQAAEASPAPPGEAAIDDEKLKEAAAAPAVADMAPPATEQQPEGVDPLQAAPEDCTNIAGDKPSDADDTQPPPLEDVEAAAAPPPEATPPLPVEPDAEDPLQQPLREQEIEATPKWTPPTPKAKMTPLPERAPELVERSSYDLVDKMQYLFVRVVRARSLSGNTKPHVRVAAGGRRVSTRPARRVAFFSEWDQTFAFARDPTIADSSTLEISVWDFPPDTNAIAAGEDEHFLGGVFFDVSDIPTRGTPDGPLAPQWYRLEGGKARGADLMLATWMGTQADESFRDALKADVPSRHAWSGSKVYQSPKLWYLRATVLEAQDAIIMPSRDAGVSVRVTLGFQVLRTRPSGVTRNGAQPSWNEDLVFVAAEPFGNDQRLVLSLEYRNGKEPHTVVGSAIVPLSTIERRVDDRKVASRWLDFVPTEEIKRRKKSAHVYGGRLHVRVCLDGGYHVSDEQPHASSDYRPSARQLWRSPVGSVELGIIGCRGLLPMRTVDGKGTTDAFAVAKYGPKWARTRTIADSFDPAWNEQYTWEVYEPSTVLTVAVFDDYSDGSKDSLCRPIGRIRIRISTLESNRAYRCFYPLMLLLPSGLKKMGEIELAVRFHRAGSALDLLHAYGRPILPAMHHVRPIPAAQHDPLRLAAARIVAAHLARAEPSLRREVAMYVLEAEPRGFSMRRVRANWYRITSALAWAAGLVRWVSDVRTWRHPTTTLLMHMVIVLVAWHPELLAPATVIHAAAVGVWRWRRRTRVPEGSPCVKMSQVEAADREELDEEFDTVPSARGEAVVRGRYERMRAVGTRMQVLLGDIASQAERLQALISWRDPRATGVFIVLCLMVSAVLLMVSMRVLAVAAAFYYLRHPMFRDRMPPTALNFFRRLPALSDRIM